MFLNEWSFWLAVWVCPFLVGHLGGHSVPSTSPKSKIECSLLPNFCGYFYFEEDLLFAYQNRLWFLRIDFGWRIVWNKCSVFCFDVKSLDLTNIPLASFLRFVDAKIRLAFLNPIEQVHSPQNEDKNNTNFWRNCQWKEASFQDRLRRQMKIEQGYLSRGLHMSVGLADSWGPQEGLHQIDWILFLLVVC